MDVSNYRACDWRGPWARRMLLASLLGLLLVVGAVACSNDSPTSGHGSETVVDGNDEGDTAAEMDLQQCVPGEPCDDHDPCSVADKCDSQGICRGSPLTCDDQLQCTNDLCQAGSCKSAPHPGHCVIDGQCYLEGDSNPLNSCVECITSVSQVQWTFDDSNACTDGDECTLGEFCMEGQCISTATELDCDDLNPCTDDDCQPESGCQHEFNSQPCDDGDLCTIEDKCDQGFCLGESVDCYDGNPCTLDSCDPLQGCTYVAAPGACSDGNDCTLGDLCSAGQCMPGNGKLDCEDFNPCTNDMCKPQGGCTHLANQDPCDDGDPCTTGEGCVDGACVPGTVLFSCDDENVCTQDSCDSQMGCMYAAAQGACDDGDACTLNDTCQAGVCVAGPQMLVCDDTNPCTNDTCHPVSGCQHKYNSAPCDDDNYCTSGDTCTFGACAGYPVDCSDDNPCTTDGCQPDTPGGCVHAPNDLPCDDHDPCTLGDACLDSQCIPGHGQLQCDDGNQCTQDTCAAGVGCSFFNIVAYCDDGNDCTAGDYCDAGSCVGGPNSCVCQFDSDCDAFDDGNLCNGLLFCDKSSPLPKDWTCKAIPDSQVVCDSSQDSACLLTQCAPYSGQCNKIAVNEGGECDDENQCTAEDHCNSGSCLGTMGVNCDDLNVCTSDVCSPSQGCLHKPAAEGSPCGPPGWLCQAGTCAPCVPSCAGKDCGSDGCGGSCGQCSGNAICDNNTCVHVGVMECLGNATPSYPSCGNITFEGCCDDDRVLYCEDDQLYCIDCVLSNSQCGWDFEALFYDCEDHGKPDPSGQHPMDCEDCLPPCPAGYTCQLGQCVDCLPECQGKECGSDGCNGSCGSCAMDESCVDGACVPDTLSDCNGFIQPSYSECGSVDFAGCCDSLGRLIWCDQGELYCANCAELNPQCGWLPEYQIYDCGTEGAGDSSGEHPKQCSECVPACWPGFACIAGVCVACQPQCSGKECGDDSCGGSCGVCGAGHMCLQGSCVSTTTCGSITETGECQGDTVVWCQNNQVHEQDCGAEDKQCVYIEAYDKYGCALDCGDLPTEGQCTGTLLTTCTENGAEEIECAEFGMSCGFDSDAGEFACVTGCGDIDYYGTCEGDTLHYCSSPYGAGGELITVVCSDFGLTCGLANQNTGFDCIDQCGGVSQAGYCDGDVFIHCDPNSDPPAVVQLDCALIGLVCGFTAEGNPGCVPPEVEGDMVVSGAVTYDKRTVNEQGFGPTVQVPAQQVKITLWDTLGTDSENDDVALASSFTTADGTYTLAHEETSTKVYVVAYAHWGQGANSLHVDISESAGWESTWATVAAASAAFSPGVQVSKSLHITIANGSGAFNILGRLLEGWYFANEHLGPAPSVWVQWDGPNPSGFCWYGSYYDPKEQYIHIASCNDDPDEFDDSVILHEFGHHVSFSMSIDDNPGGPHWVEWTVDPRMAWSEGFASFFGQAVLGQPVYIDASDYDALVFDLEEASEMCPAKPYLGMNQDICEALVGGALWDIHDSLNTEHDSLWEDPDEIMDVLNYYPQDSWQDRGVSGVDFVDFLDGWFCRGHQQFSGLYELVVDGAQFPYDFAGPCSKVTSPVQVDLQLIAGQSGSETSHVQVRVTAALDAQDITLKLIGSGGIEMPHSDGPVRFDLRQGQEHILVVPVRFVGRRAKLAAVVSHHPHPALRYSSTAVVKSPQAVDKQRLTGSRPGRMPGGKAARLWPAVPSYLHSPLTHE